MYLHLETSYQCTCNSIRMAVISYVQNHNPAQHDSFNLNASLCNFKYFPFFVYKRLNHFSKNCRCCNEITLSTPPKFQIIFKNNSEELSHIQSSSLEKRVKSKKYKTLSLFEKIFYLCLTFLRTSQFKILQQIFS